MDKCNSEVVLHLLVSTVSWVVVLPFRYLYLRLCIHITPLKSRGGSRVSILYLKP